MVVVFAKEIARLSLRKIHRLTPSRIIVVIIQNPSFCRAFGGIHFGHGLSFAAHIDPHAFPSGS
jgi:hypothetical protein